MAKVPRSVSEFDLNYVLDQIGKTVENLTEEEFKAILFSLGVDTSRPIDKETVLHYPKFILNNTPFNGIRYTGVERQDKEWLFSSKSSLENVINSQDDAEHRKDLLMMSRQSGHPLVVELEKAEEQARKSKE